VNNEAARNNVTSRHMDVRAPAERRGRYGPCRVPHQGDRRQGRVRLSAARTAQGRARRRRRRVVRDEGDAAATSRYMPAAVAVLAASGGRSPAAASMHAHVAPAAARDRRSGTRDSDTAGGAQAAAESRRRAASGRAPDSARQHITGARRGAHTCTPGHAGSIPARPTWLLGDTDALSRDFTRTRSTETLHRHAQQRLYTDTLNRDFTRPRFRPVGAP
jgi:hypothetical protein